jgi:N-acetylneuraminate synthase
MNKTLIIAEAGVNHNGDIELAKKLIDAAFFVGADIVKFQTSKPSESITRKAPKASYQEKATGRDETQLEMLEKLSLNEDSHIILFNYCQEKGIEFLSSPFFVGGIDLLFSTLGLKRIKIGSGEIINAPLLLKAAQSGCQVLLSTGMSSLGEIDDALAILAYGFNNTGAPKCIADIHSQYKTKNAKLCLQDKVTLLHCTTEYPAPYEDVNLNAIKFMESNFGLPVGYSDHTIGTSIPIAAVAAGAQIIEKHLTLDKMMPGPDHKASLEPDEFGQMVRSIRIVEKAMGDGNKRPMPSELENKKIVRKSLVACSDIRRGDILTDKNMTVKRPGTGMSPLLYWDILGKVTTKDYSEDDFLDEYPTN